MSDDLFPEYTEGLDEEWREVFDTLVGQGKSPSGVRGAIEYATTIKTQEQAADEWGTSTVSIRHLKDDVVEAGPIDIAQHANWSWSKTTKADYLTELAEELGWEKGEEYRIEHGDSPVLTRKGWREVHELIIGKKEDH